MDCKAIVNIAEYSRGGKLEGIIKLTTIDMGCTEKYIPCGIVDEDSGQLHINFGSSYKTSYFIVDSLIEWWNTITPEQQIHTELSQIKIDNGPESSGIRTQFLNSIVEFVDQTKTPIQLLYYAPYHSKYNPIERCWGILEQHWNGSKLVDVTTMLSWAKSRWVERYTSHFNFKQDCLPKRNFSYEESHEAS